MFINLFEMGYAPLALVKNSKRPIPNGWQKFSESLPDQHIVDLWQKDFVQGKINLGVVCGKASNLIALDIDVDDQELYKIIPPSSVRKRGGKGEVRFFRYNESQFSESRHFTDSFGCGVLDILSTGTQTVLPPSLHPETGKPYIWLTEDTLFNTKSDDLPMLESNWLEDFNNWLNRRNAMIEKVKGSVQSNYDQSKRVVGGRNNKLKEIVTAMRARGCEEREVIDEIYNYDLVKHAVRLFTDKEENKKYQTEEDAYNNAARFYASVNSSLISKGIIKYQKESKEISIDFDDSAIEEAKKEAFKQKPYPKPRGIMAEFQELCELRSAGKQDATGLGGAISLMSAICSNRFVTECRGLVSCPNTYVINLGYSSFGKEMAQTILHELLSDSGLIGSGSFRSSVSVIMNLPKQQERLDIIDECSSLLSAMGSKESHSSQIVELLSELFTKGPTKYHGQTSLSNGEKFGACYNPHISILGSTTPKGFRSSVNKDIAAKGLLPRMLLFFQQEIGDYAGRKKRDGVDEKTNKLKSLVNKILSFEKKVHPDFKDINLISPAQNKEGMDLSQGIRYTHTVIPMSTEANEFWLNYEEDCYNKKKSDPDGFESAFIGRFAELVAKLALLDSVSIGSSVINVDSIIWAIEVVEAQWHNAKPLYDIAHAENKTEGDIIRVLNFIKERGIVDRTTLARKCQWLELRFFNQAIQTLIETDQIESVLKENKSGAGRKKTYYRVKRS